MLKFCVENFHNLEKSMSYAFSISHVGELSGQNRCTSGIQNIESNTHGLTVGWLLANTHSLKWDDCWSPLELTRNCNFPASCDAHTHHSLQPSILVFQGSSYQSQLEPFGVFSLHFGSWFEDTGTWRYMDFSFYLQVAFGYRNGSFHSIPRPS
jgi:hypothetical protein